MLVLSRKPGEKLIVDGEISIQVLEIKGNRVRIGITAPPHVQVVREELVREDLIASELRPVQMASRF